MSTTEHQQSTGDKASDFTAIGAIWDGFSKGGKPMLSGRLELPNGEIVKVWLFENRGKQGGQNRPDFILYCLEAERGKSAQSKDNSAEHPR